MTATGCLRVGQQAPDFTATAVVDQEFKEISLSQYRGKYVVLFFYPSTSPSCVPRRSRHSAIAMPISPTRTPKYSGFLWTASSATWHGFKPLEQGGLGDINYPLVADLKEIASAYNVLDDEEGVALRGLFIIVPKV